jgi:hypothetical protein
MPGDSFTEIGARLEAQPSMVFAKCGHCGGGLVASAPDDSLSAPITYDCWQCELAWDSSGRPKRFFW